jgi:hypothetical protein
MRIQILSRINIPSNGACSHTNASYANKLVSASQIARYSLFRNIVMEKSKELTLHGILLAEIVYIPSRVLCS